MAPSEQPSASPIANSCRSTRNQSTSVTCPSAMARVISVAACEPELPPVEMHSGTNRQQHRNGFADGDSKWAMAVKVNSSATNKHDSQTVRFRQMVAKLVSR